MSYNINVLYINIVKFEESSLTIPKYNKFKFFQNDIMHVEYRLLNKFKLKQIVSCQLSNVNNSMKLHII